MSFSEPDQPVTTDVMVACRIEEEEPTAAQGEEPATVKYTLSVMRVERNGLDPVTFMLK